MSKQSLCERERSNIAKMNKFQLANKFKKVGLSVALAAFGFMIVLGYFEEPNWVKPILHGILLVGLLVISVSKEKEEDEFIDSLRSQSYRLAFLLAIVYALVQPIINYSVSYLFHQNDEIEGFNYFQVLFFMLIVQLMFFYKLRKMNN